MCGRGPKREHLDFGTSNRACAWTWIEAEALEFGGLEWIPSGRGSNGPLWSGFLSFTMQTLMQSLSHCEDEGRSCASS